MEMNCKHELPTLQCSICKVPDPRSVIYTDGGLHYHLNRSCKNLIAGQDIVRARGGTPSPIRNGFEHLVKEQREPCRFCVGWST